MALSSMLDEGPGAVNVTEMGGDSLGATRISSEMGFPARDGEAHSEGSGSVSKRRYFPGLSVFRMISGPLPSSASQARMCPWSAKL